jgi:hypothetical protein
LRDGLPERLPDEELEEIKKMITPTDEAPEEAPPVFEETPEAPEVFEFSFGADFEEHFAPSEEYISDDEDGFEEPPVKESRSIIKEMLQRLRHDEEPPALTPAAAHERARAYALNLRLRALLAAVFTIPLIMMSAGLNSDMLPGFLSYSGDGKPYIALLVMVLLQLAVMLCGIDVIGRGLSDLIRLKPGAETLLAFACFSSFLYAGSIALADTTSETSFLYSAVGFPPYCAVIAASVVFAMWGYSHRYYSYARTYKVLASLNDECDCVVSEENLWGNSPGFSRRSAIPVNFIAQTEMPDIVSRVMRFFSPFLMVAAIVLAALSASYHDEGQYFFWTLSALCAVCVPFTTFCSYPFIWSRISKRLEDMGSAINGWSAAAESSRGEIIVVEDRDLFPPGTMTLNGLKILGDHSFSDIISYSASLLHSSGSGLYKALEPVVRDHAGQLKSVSALEIFEGGLSGSIKGERIMVGTLNFMHSMGIQVPPELSSKTAVFTSVNHDLAGVLAVSYTPSSNVKGALLLLENQKMTNVLAVRDINISLNLLRDKFSIDPDLLEYPIVEERIQLSNPKRPYHGKVTGVISRDGLCPYAEAVIGGQRLHRFTIINMCVHLLALVFGMMLVFYFASQTQPVAAAMISPGNILSFLFIWWAAQWLISCFSHRY